MNRRVIATAIAAVLSATATTSHMARAGARAEARMVEAARTFIATLDGNGRERALEEFESPARFDWYFTPVQRTGLPLEAMTPAQRSAALALLQSALSSQGFLKATGVMRLEEILGILENRPDRRNPEDYHFWIFGTPAVDARWGWRFEGHHVSLNFTSGGGLTVTTPAFIGANPARVPSGPHAGWRLLANEEDLARRLVLSFDAAQRDAAVIADASPGDIVTGNAREARLERMEGLAIARMNDEQRSLLMRLLGEYVGNVAPEIAAARWERIRETGIEKLHFAWAGGLEPGDRHYYRIHGPTILIEYDNSQGNANHIHSVWRDLENDFGGDLLRRHYESAGDEHGHDHPHVGGRSTDPEMPGMDS